MHINVWIRKWDGRTPICLIFRNSKRKLNVKMKEIRPFTATLMDLEIVIVSEARQRRGNIRWHPFYVESKKK